MNKLWMRLLVLVMCMQAYTTNAQLLPDNKTLNAQSVERWMQSNRSMAPIMQLLDEMNATAEALQTFDALSPAEQDQQINQFLTEKNTLAAANTTATTHGWKSVGEYMRLSTRLGNAIAAYFLAEDLAQLPEEHAKLLREKTNPAVLAVPEKDIAFIKANEKPLRQYIKAYAAGR
jgi:hypothetical protein